MDFAIIDVDEIGQSIAIDIPEQDTFRVIAQWKARAVAHRYAVAPIAITQVGPIRSVTIVYKNDVLHTIARHVAPFDARIGEIYVWKILKRLALDSPGFVPSLLGVVKKAFEPGARADYVGYPISG